MSVMVSTLKNISCPINTLVKQLPLNTKAPCGAAFQVSNINSTLGTWCQSLWLLLQSATPQEGPFFQGPTPATCCAVWATAKLGYKSGFAVGREPSGGGSSERGSGEPAGIPQTALGQSGPSSHSGLKMLDLRRILLQESLGRWRGILPRWVHP